MASLEDDTYGYMQGEEIRVRLKSSNQFGYSDYQEQTLQSKLRVVPHKMQPLTRNALTDPTVIVIDWLPLTSPADGDSPVLGYHVMWKHSDSETWSDLVYPDFPYIETTASATQSLIEGDSYEFKVRARNVYGFGEFSDIQAIIASTHPERPNIVNTITDGLKVLVSFEEPPSNGEAISVYTVEFYSRDGNFYQSDECD